MLLVLLLTGMGLLLWWSRNLVTLPELHRYEQVLSVWFERHPHLGMLLYFAVYYFISVMPVPAIRVAFVMLAGALFSFWQAVIMSSFAGVFGAATAFLLVRYVFRGFIEQRYQPLMNQINQGLQRSGSLFVFSLRLLPVVPYSAVNAACGLTRFSILRFCLATQLGMLPLILIYTNAGQQLAHLQSINDIVTPGFVASMLVLALFPWLVRWFGQRLKLTNP